MVDPVREALRILLNEIDDLSVLRTVPDLRNAVEDARTALAAEPPAPAEPDTDAVLTLAAIIRQAAGNGLPGAARLAELILSHPNVARVFQPPAPAPAAELIPVVYDAGGGVRIKRIIAPDGDWSVRNSRHISPVTGFPTAAAAWAALQQARRQEVGDE